MGSIEFPKRLQSSRFRSPPAVVPTKTERETIADTVQKQQQPSIQKTLFVNRE